MSEAARSAASESGILEQLEPLRREIDQQLDQATAAAEGWPESLREAMRYMLLAPGKRLRPLLCLLAARACGAPHRRALPAAAAVEMIHTYSLIHDDLPAMDDDDLRRGRATCHVMFGEALAILAGDALLALAFAQLAELDAPELAGRCCAELARAAGPCQLVGGQVDDLAAEREPVGDLAQLEAIHLRKTAAMLRVSLCLGGLVAGASGQHLGQLDEYGRGLGLAFQITDDLLDSTGRVERVGKRTGKDQMRGKLTYPRLLGAQASRARAEQLVEHACRALVGLPGETDWLQALAAFICKRDR